MARHIRPKLTCPLDFSRKCHNGCTFLNSCSLYIHLAPEQFHNKEERILWALMFFKSSRAAKWSENVFCQEAVMGDQREFDLETRVTTNGNNKTPRCFTVVH